MTSPTQNEGIESPSSAKIFPMLSYHWLTRTAAMIPVGMPTISENTIAAAASINDAGSRDR